MDGRALASLCLVAVLAAGQINDRLVDKVLRRFDLIDIDAVLNNKRILNSYIKCMLHQGVCSPEARDFRRLTPTFLRSLCSNCTEKQRTTLRKIYSHVQVQAPSDWDKLVDYYDPNKKYRKGLNNFIKDNQQ